MKNLCAVFVVFFAVSHVTGQEGKQTDSETAKAKEDAVKIPLIPIKVRVVDSSGAPVPGAKVTPRGLRSVVEPGSHWMWPESAVGKPPKAVTNEDGIAELVYPKFITEKLETGQVTWYVDHPDYVIFYEDRGVEADVAKIELRNGFRIASTAKGLDGKRLTRDLFAIQSGGGGGWKIKKGGVLTSRVFDRKQSWLRLLHMPEDGPILYSDLQPVFPKEGQSRVFLRDVELKPGCRVEGTLGADVPRPIKNGKVAAIIVVPGAPGPNGGDKRWFFSNGVTIEEDGTFVFPSLPVGDVVQMIATCDGWISRQPDVAKAKDDFPDIIDNAVAGATRRWPQPFLLEGAKISPVMPMEKTGTVKILVQDPDGNPLPNSRVFMWPNQNFFSYGSQILGSYYDSLKAMKDERSGRKSNSFRSGDFSATTDENGYAIIRNLPGPGSQEIAVQHPSFDMPIRNGDRSTTITVKLGETSEHTIKLQAKGKDRIGEP